MHSVVLIIFILTYTGVAIGRVPGLMLDRTGIAILGAIAMIMVGALSFEEAFSSIDLPTILLLYGLMILSAQLRLGGFYTFVALRITVSLDYPRRFLFICMITSGILSSILANDIICLAFTPVLTVSLLKTGRNPIPFLLGLAISSNIGSATTLIGNPQNMLIGQVGHLHFGPYFLWAFIPSIISLISSYGILCLVYRGHFFKSKSDNQIDVQWSPFDLWQTSKGLIATTLLLLFFLTAIPRELSAIAIAGVLLCSRKIKSSQILEHIDWHLITLFCALFIVIQGFSSSGIPATIVIMLNEFGLDLSNHFVLTFISAFLSNMVSNVPATMLLIQFLSPTDHVSWYILALSSTFAGNLLLIGSIANLIVVEQARHFGIHISFREHARSGIPVAFISLFILILWTWLLRV